MKFPAIKTTGGCIPLAPADRSRSWEARSSSRVASIVVVAAWQHGRLDEVGGTQQAESTLFETRESGYDTFETQVPAHRPASQSSLDATEDVLDSGYAATV